MKTTSTVALLAAAGLLMGGVALAPKAARAADLGGDCCADLESRVAELEATTARKGNRKMSLTITGRVNYNIMYWNENSTGPNTGAAAVPAKIDPISGAPIPGAAAKGNGPFDDTSGFNFGNVGRNESEVVFKGSGKISSDVQAGFSMEIYVDPDVYQSPTSASVAGCAPSAPPCNAALTQTGNENGPGLLARTEYVYLSSKSMGELRLGYQYTAMHESWGSDLSKDVIGKYGQTRDAMRFFLRDSNGFLTSANYQSVLRPLEDSRGTALLYVSPTWEGFNFRASVGGDSTYAGEALYSNKFGTVSVQAGLGYLVAHDADGDAADQSCAIPAASSTSVYTGVGCQSQGFQPRSAAFALTNFGSDLKVLGASASIYESGSGLFVTAEYSKAYANNSTPNTNRQDADNWMAKGGWQKDVSGIGNTDIYALYLRQNNLLTNDTSSHMWGVGVDQAIDSVASDMYLQYQRISFDTDGVIFNGKTPINSQSVDEVIGGMIIRF